VATGEGIRVVSDQPFHPLQPKDGDLVARCGHEGQRHCFFVGELALRKEDQCDDPDCPNVVSWYVCCDECFGAAIRGELLINAHGAWMGNEPEFRLPKERAN
jgi:hypothetical protein